MVDGVTESEVEEVLSCIDEETAKTVWELEAETSLSVDKVQRVLEELGERNKYTSTPDFEYRLARKR